MEPKVQKWRDHFAECEADQLRRFPLHALTSTIDLAQYEVARKYLVTQRKRGANYGRVVALCADEPTRRAFFDLFEPKQQDWFCFRRDEWPSILSGRSRGSGVWPFQAHHHGFQDCCLMETGELRQKLGQHFEELQHEPLFLRSYGFRDASRAGLGGSDLWHWSGEQMVHLPEHDSRWVS